MHMNFFFHVWFFFVCAFICFCFCFCFFFCSFGQNLIRCQGLWPHFDNNYLIIMNEISFHYPISPFFHDIFFYVWTITEIHLKQISSVSPSIPWYPLLLNCFCNFFHIIYLNPFYIQSSRIILQNEKIHWDDNDPGSGQGINDYLKRDCRWSQPEHCPFPARE